MGCIWAKFCSEPGGGGRATEWPSASLWCQKHDGRVCQGQPTAITFYWQHVHLTSSHANILSWNLPHQDMQRTLWHTLGITFSLGTKPVWLGCELYSPGWMWSVCPHTQSTPLGSVSPVSVWFWRWQLYITTFTIDLCLWGNEPFRDAPQSWFYHLLPIKTSAIFQTCVPFFKNNI